MTSYKTQNQMVDHYRKLYPEGSMPATTQQEINERHQEALDAEHVYIHCGEGNFHCGVCGVHQERE